MIYPTFFFLFFWSSRHRPSSITVSKILSLYYHTVIPLYRGSVHPLQDVALRTTSPVVSLSGISAPSDSFHLHDVVSPSLHLSTSWSFAISWLPVCDPFRPSVVIESCYMACPFPFLLGCEFDYVFNICFCSNFTARYFIFQFCFQHLSLHCSLCCSQSLGGSFGQWPRLASVSHCGEYTLIKHLSFKGKRHFIVLENFSIFSETAPSSSNPAGDFFFCGVF